MLKKKCLTCQKEFVKSSTKSRKLWDEEVKYCSRECSKTIFKKGLIPWNKGKVGVMPPVWNKGKHVYMGGKRFEKGSKAIHPFLKGHIPWNKGKRWLEMSGEKHPNWKGGITREFIRFSYEYKMWRNYIFERDNYTCQICGKRGERLQADHIKPQSLYPELRFSINNGRTLCVDCHRKTDTWGYNTAKIALIKKSNFVSDEASGR